MIHLKYLCKESRDSPPVSPSTDIYDSWGILPFTKASALCPKLLAYAFLFTRTFSQKSINLASSPERRVLPTCSRVTSISCAGPGSSAPASGGAWEKCAAVNALLLLIWGRCWHEWRSRTECTVGMPWKLAQEGKPVSPVSFQRLLLLKYHLFSPGKCLDMMNLSTGTRILLAPRPSTPASRGQSLAGHSGNTTGQALPCPLRSLQALGRELHCKSRKFYSWRCSSRLSGPNILLE